MILKVLVVCLLFVIHSSSACTEFIVSSADKATVVGRTMEFDANFKWNVVSAPKGIPMKATVPKQCKNPLQWTSKHKVMYINAHSDVVKGSDDLWLDGQNDAGLSVGALYFPDYFYYPKDVPVEKCSNAVSHLEMVNYILTTYESVKEVKKALDDDKFAFVWELPTEITLPDGEKTAFVFPIHWSIVDKTGDAIILEYTEQEGRRVFINEVGVFTNSPTYDWHTTNLNSYINIHNVEFEAKTYKRNDVEYTLKPFGHGSGMLGLPGDFTPPSRFIRTATFVRFSKESPNASEAALKAWHIINTVDMPKETMGGMTDWAVVKDLTNNIMYYRGQSYIGIRKIEMNRTSNTKSEFVFLEDTFEASVEDVTDKMQDYKPSGHQEL